MNRIKNISIEGFKSIEKMDIELKQLNVMIGANGAGKSNFISFFRMLNYMQAGRLQEYIGLQGASNAILHYGAKQTFHLSFEIEFESYDTVNNFHAKLAHAAGDSLIFTDEEYVFNKYYPDYQMKIPSSAGHKESVLLNPEQMQEIGGYEKQIAHVLLMWMREWQVFQFHDTSPTALIKQKCYLDDSYWLRADGGNLAPFLYHMKNSKPEHYNRIVETIRLCAPFFDNFVLIPRDKYIILNWKEKGRDNLFGPHQLSDGTLRLMALVTLLLQPKPPSLIIIDEPELGLHPYAITVLVGLLREASEKSQVLVSTQSAYLIDLLEPEDIIVVDRVDGASTFRRLDCESLKDWLETYTISELWEKNVLGGRP